MDEANLREALIEARKVLVVACGEKAPYIRVALEHIDEALEAALRQPTGAGQRNMLAEYLLNRMPSDWDYEEVLRLARQTPIYYQDYVERAKGQAGATGQPTGEPQDGLDYIRHMVEHDHRLYCRKDGSACVATCVNGRAILERAANPATVAAVKPPLWQQADLAAQLAEVRLDEAKWWHMQRGHHGTGWCCERIDALEHAIAATAATPLGEKEQPQASETALREAVDLAIGFCVAFRDDVPDWHRFPEVGKLFAKLTVIRDRATQHSDQQKEEPK